MLQVRAMKLVLILLIAGCGGNNGNGNPDGGSDPGDMAGGGSNPDFSGVPVTSYTCARSIEVMPGSNVNSKATQNAQAGDCVKVHAGNYTESTTINFGSDGTASMPIVLWSV